MSVPWTRVSPTRTPDFSGSILRRFTKGKSGYTGVGTRTGYGRAGLGRTPGVLTRRHPEETNKNEVLGLSLRRPLDGSGTELRPRHRLGSTLSRRCIYPPLTPLGAC